MVVWPPSPLVREALMGRGKEFKTEAGHTMRGLRSNLPWVYWAGVVECERCGAKEDLPPARTKAPGAREKLRMWSEQVLGELLYPFGREHKKCERRS